MDGGVILLVIAASEEIIRPTHWMGWAAFGGTMILAVAALIILLLLCVSDHQKLKSGPIYLRRAPSFLKWIAITAPTLALFGFIFHFLYAYTDIVTRKPIELESLAALLIDVILPFAIGLGVSLISILGIAIYFFRTASDQ